LGTRLIKAEFADSELPDGVIKATHQPVYDTLNLAKFYKESVRRQLDSMSDQDLMIWFNQISALICAQTHIIDSLSEFKKKEDQYYSMILELKGKFT
jgi:hypothetical protein